MGAGESQEPHPLWKCLVMTWPLRKAENSDPLVYSAASFCTVAPGSATDEKEKPTRPTFPAKAVESIKYVGNCVLNKPFVLSLDIKAGGDTALGLVLLSWFFGFLVMLLRLGKAFHRLINLNSGEGL